MVHSNAAIFFESSANLEFALDVIPELANRCYSGIGNSMLFQNRLIDVIPDLANRCYSGNWRIDVIPELVNRCYSGNGQSMLFHHDLIPENRFSIIFRISAKSLRHFRCYSGKTNSMLFRIEVFDVIQATQGNINPNAQYSVIN